MLYYVELGGDCVSITTWDNAVNSGADDDMSTTAGGYAVNLDADDGVSTTGGDVAVEVVILCLQ